MQADSNKINEREEEIIRSVCGTLRGYEYILQDYLAEIVASLCSVEVDDMLSQSAKLSLSQPRWLFWYAYRYLTNSTYDSISEHTKRKCGKTFTPNGIGQSVNKMSQLIENEPIWKKRWTIVKRIIKDISNHNDKDKDSIPKMRIHIPSELRDMINIEFTNEKR